MSKGLLSKRGVGTIASHAPLKRLGDDDDLKGAALEPDAAVSFETAHMRVNLIGDLCVPKTSSALISRKIA